MNSRWPKVIKVGNAVVALAFIVWFGQRVFPEHFAIAQFYPQLTRGSDYIHIYCQCGIVIRKRRAEKVEKNTNHSFLSPTTSAPDKQTHGGGNL